MRVTLEAMNGHGQSIEPTIDKERCLSVALAIGMKIANAPTRPWRGRDYAYWHLDVTSGCGHNDLADVPGSPVVFQMMADQYLTHMRSEAFFCDMNEYALDELWNNRLTDEWRSRSHRISGDNEDALIVFAKSIQRRENQQYAIGSVIVDPNGWWYRNSKGEGPPIENLPRFAAKFPRIDIVANLNVGAYWRQVPEYSVIGPYEVLGLLHKRHWLVRKTVWGANRFLLVIGRNLGTGDIRSLGFHKIESVEGQEIMAWAEGKRQHDLFTAI